MKKKNMFYFVGLILILVLLYFGMPQKFGINAPFFPFYAEWDNSKVESKSEIFNIEEQIPVKNAIIIKNISSRQEIYEPNDKAHIDFMIINKLNISYNLTVDWLTNNTRYHGWFNFSNEQHRIDAVENMWESWYYLPNTKGNWKAHVVVRYNWHNQTFSNDNTVTFEVI